MSNLTAFKFEACIVVAAESPQQAWQILQRENPTGVSRRTHFVRDCGGYEMDTPLYDEKMAPAPTLRQRLADASEPGVLLGLPKELGGLKPPAGWQPCSPELLLSGVCCHTAPRWSIGSIGPHWHPPACNRITQPF